MDAVEMDAARDVQDVAIISVYLTGKGLGVAVFDEATSTIANEGFHVGNSNDLYETVHHLALLYPPETSKFLLPPHIASNTELLALLRTHPSTGACDAYSYRTLKSACWNAATAQETLCSLLFVKELWKSELAVHMTEQATMRDNFLRISSAIDLDNTVLKQAMAALVGHMNAEGMSTAHGFVVVSRLVQLDIVKMMHIDMQSITALEVFTQESHPNIIKSRGQCKEGFSLFGLFDRTKSQPGRTRLRDWMSRPFYDRDAIVQRQDGVSFVVNIGNRDVVDLVATHMRVVHSMPNLLLRIKRVVAIHVDWHRLYKSLVAAHAILDILAGFVEAPEKDVHERECLRHMLDQCDMSAVREVAAVLENAIDFKVSMAEGMIYLRDGFNAGLDSLRDVYDSLDSVLTETAHAILLSTPLLSRVSVEYVSQIGYLAAVDDADSGPELLPPSDFEPIFAQDGRQYFKHAAVRALDDRVGDIHSTILDTQKVLLRGIEDSVLDLEPDLQRVGSALADVDALLALGTVAAEMDFVRPDISEQPIIAIKQGRHPLQELTVDIFVPNDTFVSEASTVGIITGPNGSGKSVYAKQVGVLVYLAHIGSWLPCEKAIIGLTDKILTRIDSVESVTTPSSSFALDLTQMNRMLATHTQRSLCLVDEFGKGTAPIDGIALLATIITKFVATKTRAFFVLHFTEVLDALLLGQETLDALSVFRMETVFDPATNPTAKRILHTPIYKLGVGMCEDSKGMACAKEAGVPDEVLERSYHIKECLQSRSLLRPLTVDGATVFSTKQRRLVKAFLDLDLEEAQPDLTSFFAAMQSMQ